MNVEEIRKFMIVVFLLAAMFFSGVSWTMALMILCGILVSEALGPGLGPLLLYKFHVVF